MTGDKENEQEKRFSKNMCIESEGMFKLFSIYM